MEQPLLAIELLGSEPARTRLTRTERNRWNRSRKPTAERGDPLEYETPFACSIRRGPSSMIHLHPHARRLGGIALAPEIEHSRLVVDDPPMGADLLEAFEEEAGRN